MSTVERLEILKEKLEEKPKWWVINMEEQPKVVENGHIYTEPPAETRLLASQKVINELLEKVSNLEFEIEKLEKNEQYKYINGQAYFRQDYVLGREKEIDRLNAELNLYKDNQEHLNNLLEQKNNIINEIESIVYADISNIDARITIQEVLDKELKGSDKE